MGGDVSRNSAMEGETKVTGSQEGQAGRTGAPSGKREPSTIGDS